MVTKSFVVLGDETPAQTKPGLAGQESATGRYEFRVWPHDMPQAAALLQQSWSLVGAERRKDLYLLTEHSPLTLVKLRAGNRLEVKSRGLDHGPLQYWTHPPCLSAVSALSYSLAGPGRVVESDRLAG